MGRGRILTGITVTLAVFSTLQSTALASEPPRSEWDFLAARGAVSEGNVSCSGAVRFAGGHGEVEDPVPGVVPARDAVGWSVACASSQTEDAYQLKMVIALEALTDGSWQQFTDATCSTPSIAGQAVRPDCVKVVTFPAKSPLLDTWHRARFCLDEPMSHCFYSSSWWMGDVV